MNQAMLVGLVVGCEMRRQGDTPLLKMRVKTPTQIRKDDGDKLVWDYHFVAVWGRAATDAQAFVSEGAAVTVIGRIVTSRYEKDGVKHYSTEINASSVSPSPLLLDAPAGGDDAGA